MKDAKAKDALLRVRILINKSRELRDVRFIR